MAVTTANTLKLSDVCLEIYGSSNTLNKTLVGLHAAATGTFNPSYAVAGADTLLDFRGYEHSVPIYTMYLTLKGFVVSTDACGLTCNQLRYFTGEAPFIIAIGDTVYTDSGGTIPFNGASRWYGQNTTLNNNSTIVCQINSSGVCIGSSFCSP